MYLKVYDSIEELLNLSLLKPFMKLLPCNTDLSIQEDAIIEKMVEFLINLLIPEESIEPDFLFNLIFYDNLLYAVSNDQHITRHYYYYS